MWWICLENGNNGAFAIFNASGFFKVPCGANRLRVLVVGGGGGGGSGTAGGGGAGFVKSSIFEVEPNVIIEITVGAGGKGSTRKDTCLQNSQPGGRSSFGSVLHAEGGDNHKGPCTTNSHGSSGGTGGGAGCVNIKGYCHSGAGGSGGSDGSNASRGQSSGPGAGQGNYNEQLKLFRNSSITAGAGGRGKLYAAAGGGGGGGILINGLGPVAGSGQEPAGSQGGKGYGAGGGSGFLQPNQNQFHSGGNGADGVVYVEWYLDMNQSSYIKIAQPTSSMSINFILFVKLT